MLAHHFVTTGLIFASYGYHQTKIGNVILCIMDSVDLFFPVSFSLPHCTPYSN
jgi:acyl-CoA-dependent ceramide synthase